ncbi:tubulin delta [Strigomonas culicis]|uniref:Tubulin delta chain n=1 Tax=Strigomonas culicis TaxID=28005 RepID=S9WH07_9TRYP|nr:tubulin delta [Strigomonas culicis]|eukprot:EPY35050.1 tubulin delta [Strigomonas culicis]
MSTAHVFVGQCGNQLGTAFLDTLAQEADESQSEEYQLLVSSTHFRPALKRPKVPAKRTAGAALSGTSVSRELPQPRCVMIDMEPKVIDQMVTRRNGSAGDGEAAALYNLAPQQCVMQGSGSANNWAYGYLQQGAKSRDAIEEALRREGEAAAASISTYHVVHSVAGGTGSGVSCLVAEVVKDLFPTATLLHTVVWPFDCGEVVTQWFNTVLCMASLRDSVDGVFVAFNEDVADQLRGRYATVGLPQKAEVHFDAMNHRISRLLTPLHLPALLYAVPPPYKAVSANTLGRGDGEAPLPEPLRFARSEDLVEALTLDPATKFFTGALVPKLPTGTTRWSAVVEEAARRAQQAFTAPSVFHTQSGLSPYGMNSPHTCLWTLRGYESRTTGMRELQRRMTAADRFPLSALLVSPLTASRPSPSGADQEVTLYGPSPRIGAGLQRALERTEELLHVGAFAHHFEQYGVGKHELLDCTAKLWDTVAAYTPGAV